MFSAPTPLAILQVLEFLHRLFSSVLVLLCYYYYYYYYYYFYKYLTSDVLKKRSYFHSYQETFYTKLQSAVDVTLSNAFRCVCSCH